MGITGDFAKLSTSSDCVALRLLKPICKKGHKTLKLKFKVL